MKEFLDITFNRTDYLKELQDFKDLLDRKDELSENADILPFFRARPSLCSQIATIYPRILQTTKIAYEYDLFGDFNSDVVVGDPSTRTYCFIEFEDAKKRSLFEKNGAKYKLEFSRRFEHGYSQIIDWFCKIDGLQNTDSLLDRFDTRRIDYEAILVIGRSKFLTKAERERLDWRIKHVLVNSKHINCFTFDELYETLKTRFELMAHFYKNS
jgi:hypothetical protein